MSVESRFCKKNTHWIHQMIFFDRLTRKLLFGTRAEYLSFHVFSPCMFHYIHHFSYGGIHRRGVDKSMHHVELATTLATSCRYANRTERGANRMFVAGCPHCLETQ